jgi:hypothetical protein
MNKAKDDTGKVRRKPSPGKVRDYELAGGMEGGMPAGNAGGPGEKDLENPGKSSAGAAKR